MEVVFNEINYIFFLLIVNVYANNINYQKYINVKNLYNKKHMNFHNDNNYLYKEYKKIKFKIEQLKSTFKNNMYKKNNKKEYIELNNKFLLYKKLWLKVKIHKPLVNKKIFYKELKKLKEKKLDIKVILSYIDIAKINFKISKEYKNQFLMDKFYTEFAIWTNLYYFKTKKRNIWNLYGIGDDLELLLN